MELLDCNYSGWALKVLEKHSVDMKGISWKTTCEKVKEYFSHAIKCADMQDLRYLDELYCQDIIKSMGR